MTQARLPADPWPAQNSRVENRGQPRPSGSRQQRNPILIGISGKRIFDKTSAQADCAIAEALADRFRTLFEALDRDLPGTPKIVLTGAAFGADLIAAETALQFGRDWAVAAVLPFDRVLFEEDFHPAPDEQAWRDRYALHASAFERLLGPPDKPNPRVLVRELPKLALERGGVAPVEQLSRQSARRDKTLRRNHYEQVGQFIAEISTIMIAVTSADEQPETSEANGGTARIVAYRRAGCPDALGTAVARRSAVLRHEWSEVMLPAAGYVWLMDPRKADRTGRYPVKVLPPLVDRSVDDVYTGHPGEDMPRELETYVGPLRRLSRTLRALAARLGGNDLESGAALRRLRASLAVARGFERFHRERSQTFGAADAAVDLSPIANVPEALNSARSLISSRQREVNSYVRRDFYWLASLFLLAVILFETFAKLFHDNAWLLGSYLLVLGGIGLRALRGRWMLWEAVAEDYRAVAEILRVQGAWWSAGLTARVDREHLQGVDQDLAPIRDCAKMIIGWILLRHGWNDADPARDWAQVRGTSVQARDLRGRKKSPDDWIGSQLWYFVNNGEDRETSVHLVDAASWCLFVVSGVLAAVLWAWMAFPQVTARFEQRANSLLAWASFAGFDLIPALWLLLAMLLIALRVWNHDVRRGWEAIFLTGALGALAALGIALALTAAGALIADVTGMHDAELAAKYALLASLVVISAAAGALRYLMERLNVEAEALEYRDARGRFERAERSLARGSDPATGAPADEATARRVVYELGRLALSENEAWLKSRRERPLTPVVG
jgi:hypothetical protein